MIQYLITAIIDIAVGALAISKKENPAAKALGLTICCLGLWSLELYFLTVIKDIELLEILFHITRWGMFLAPAIFTLLTWRLLGSRSKTFRNVVMIPSFVMSLMLSLGNLLFFPSTLVEAEGGYLPKPDFIFYSFALYFIWCFLGSLALVTVSYKTSLSREKQRLKWVLITLFVCFLIGILLIGFMPNSFYLSKMVGPISNIIFVAFLFYSTTQHNLMDLRLALSVGLSKAILLGFFVWLYFVVTSVVGDHTESNGGVLILLLFVALILEAYPRLLKLILPNAKKILVKHGYEFDQVKTDTEFALRNALTFNMLQEVLDHLFLKILRLNNYKVLMIQPEKDFANDDSSHQSGGLPFETISDNNPLAIYYSQHTQLVLADEMSELLRTEMEKYQAALSFPVFSDNKPLAIVLTGEPAHFSYYRYDDMKMFEWLTNELGQVFNRLIGLSSMQDQLGEAKKTLSMLNLMNHYHHDIKAPFAIIDGVLSNDIYDRDKQRDIVLAQVERGSRLIATMASILGGKHRRRIQSCALESLVQDSLYLFETSFDRVEYELSGIPKIKGDAEDLKILLINLIKNASEARRQNQELIIKVRSWIDNNNVCFSIADNGTGMAEAQIANLWEPGFSGKKLGNGIGMQAIKRIVDEHNARIEVKSTQASGTEFILCFPSTQIATDDDNIEQTIDELAERRATYQIEKRNTL
mgnify:CR=1 FL=1